MTGLPVGLRTSLLGRVLKCIRMDDRMVAKLISFFLIFILMVIAGLLPIKVSDWYNKKGEKGRHYISVLNCFGGGVFFGTYLMHMAPEVRELLEESLLTPNNIHYPLPELAIGFGFFLLLFIDKFVTIIAHYGAKSSVEPQAMALEDRNGGVNQPSETKHKHGYRADGHLNDSRAASPRLVTRIYHDSELDHVTRKHSDSISSYNISAGAHDAKTYAYANGGSEKERAASIASIEGQKKTIEDDPHISTEDAELAARPYVFLIALSIDCIFEGISLGLQDDSYGVWMLVIAILSHELVITFSFGLRLVKLFPTKNVITIIISYASTIPIGILIGFIIYETGGGSNEIDIVSGFFLAIAAGIFIYITFLEILNEELTHDAYLSKPVAVLIGFLFMASMVLVENIGTVEDEDSGGVNATASASIHDFMLQ